jgi:ATP-dependent Clp protease ATP-binding subunit ClpA
MKPGNFVSLDPKERSADALEFERNVRSQVIGQEEAILAMSDSIQIYMAGLNNPNRTVANLLFLGPTGVGKTRVVEAAAKALFGTERAILKLNCAEFKESHQVSKILGAPAGYTGHRETPPLITQAKLNQYHTEDIKLSLLLLDEIEKANPSFWEVFLNVLDRGTLTQGNGEEIDFRRTIIIMTSNAGARQMQEAITGGMGFSGIAGSELSQNKDLKRISQEAARKYFSPEFWGRLDKVVTFHTLSRAQLLQVLDLELANIQKRILTAPGHQQFVLKCTPQAKEFILNEHADLRYGARDLQHSVERNLVRPLSTLLATGQVTLGDLVLVFFDGTLRFDKVPAESVAQLPPAEWGDFLAPEAAV